MTKQKRLEQKLSGKLAVITGAASGIGKALALQLDGAGARLALSDVNQEALEALHDELGQRHHIQVLDVSNRKAVLAYAKKLQKSLGNADLLFNNAGVAISETIEGTSFDDFEWLMNINFWGVVNGTKAFLPQMKEQESASIINVSSVLGLIAVAQLGAYNASKFAVRGFSETLRAELADSNVMVHTVHPGGIKTNIASSAKIYTAPGDMSLEEDMGAAFQKLCMTTPEQAANIILSGVINGEERILVGPDAKVFDALGRSLPKSYTPLINRFTRLLVNRGKRQQSTAEA